MFHFSHLERKGKQPHCICQLLLSNKPHSNPVAESCSAKLGLMGEAQLQ